MPASKRRGATGALPSFVGSRAAVAGNLRTLAMALRRTTAQRHRLHLRRSRDDQREWQVKRRERTRQLIELGGLVVKAQLVDITDDDRAVIFGLLIEGAGKLRGEDRSRMLLLWRRRGQRAFADVVKPATQSQADH